MNFLSIGISRARLEIKQFSRQRDLFSGEIPDLRVERPTLEDIYLQMIEGVR